MDAEEKTVPWHIVDASQSIDEVQADINKIVEATMKRVADGNTLYKMFQEGEYALPDPSDDTN